jgi:hypothetical protein
VASIGDLFFTLGLDDAKLIPDAKKQGQAAGVAAGQEASKSLSSKLGAGLKTSFMGMGVAASGAFALATKGALEMENVQVDLQRETGLTADEAKRAASEINGIAGRNVQDIGAVSAAFAKVHNDLGLTGDAAAAATEEFVKFGRATGQDAASAVSAFDDILDAWNLTADDSQSVMDALVVSHHKYGGSIDENQSALASLAPALKAANMNWQDGLEIINLFNASGVDAADATGAFTKALAKVKSPEELQRLIADIRNTEDPLLRAQKAADLFGAKAGPKLANVLKPGSAALDEYGITAEEAAGATDKAADVIDSSFSGRVRKALSEASAALRGFGGDFGPALTGVASLGTLVGSVFPGIGSKIVGGLASALKGLGARFAALLGVELGSKVVASAASEAVAGAVTSATAESSAAGGAAKLAGSRLGSLLGLGLRLGLVLAVAEAADLISPELNKLGDSIHDQVFGRGSGFLGSGFSLDDVPWPLGNKGAPDWAKGASDAGKGTDQIAAAVDDSLSHIDASFDRAGEGAGGLARTLPAAVEKATPAAKTAGENVGKGITVGVSRGLKGAVLAAARAGKDSLDAYAKGILDKQSVVDQAFQALTNQAKTELTRTQEIAHIVGVLTSTELARGLLDKRPGVRAAAEATRETAYARLNELHANADTIGKGAGDALSKALASKDPAVRSAARTLRSAIERNITPKTKPKGEAAVTDVAAGLNDKTARQRVVTAAGFLVRFINSLLTINANVTVNATVRRRNTGGSHAGSAPRQHGGPVTPFGSYVVGERGPELFVPRVSGHIVPHNVSAAHESPAAANVAYNVNMTAARPTTVVDAMRELRRYGEMGLLPATGRRR